MKAKITNTSKANQGVWTDDGSETGLLVHIEPGKSRTLVLRKDYVERAKKLPFLTVEPRDLDHDGDGSNGGSVDELDQKKVADLRALAEAEGVDLQDATRKDDIIAAIRLDREAKATAAAAE